MKNIEEALTILYSLMRIYGSQYCVQEQLQADMETWILAMEELDYLKGKPYDPLKVLQKQLACNHPDDLYSDGECRKCGYVFREEEPCLNS